MSVRRALILALLLAGCASGEPWQDFAGNTYPAACRGDLSDVKTPIAFVPTSRLQWAKRHGGGPVRGLWMPGLIQIDDSLHGWIKDDAIRHERCHQRIYELTGSPHWHK